MQTYRLDGNKFNEIITNGCANLRQNYKTVDALNVFPVPDGDTGINMKMTIEAGINEISGINNNNISEVADDLSHAMLFGARGNSGVILSQFWRGFYRGLQGKSEVDVFELGEAFDAGVKQAYKAVVNPQEGTILTVCREATAVANSHIVDGMSVEEYLDIFLKEADASLQRTPDLLAVLKEAGVVDSGATGFIYIIEGIRKALDGEYIHITSDSGPSAVRIKNTFTADSELTFGYCTEFILQLQNKKVDIANFDINIIIDYMLSIGDSLVCIMDEGIVKVHVHTKEPYKVLQFGQQFGEFITIKIENMQVQHNESSFASGADNSIQCNCPECVAAREKVHKKWAVVTVANGEGLVETFKQMGADYIVNGGQTMNPSSEDFVKGFDEIDAENIIVFPNNSNIILAAMQAAEMYDKCNVYVVKTKSIAQGYSALAMLDVSSDDIDTIQEDLQGIIDHVVTGQVTYSIRDAEFDDVVIHKGDLMAICNGKIVGTSLNHVDSAKIIIDKSVNEDTEVVTIIQGQDATDDDSEELVSYIENNYPGVETEVINGGQVVYHFILAIE